MTTTAHVQNPAEFLFAGKAEFTLQSKATGQHFTYKVTESKDGQMFFVALLTGQGKQYAGCIPAADRTVFRSTRASKVDRQHPAVRGFEWFLRNLTSSQVELHHCGKCGRCGRKLTNPESIARGIGPECAERTTRGPSGATVQHLAPMPRPPVTAESVARVYAEAMGRS